MKKKKTSIKDINARTVSEMNVNKRSAKKGAKKIDNKRKIRKNRKIRKIRKKITKEKINREIS